MLTWSSYGRDRVAVGESDQVWLPPAWSGDRTQRCIVWCHGARGDFTPGPIERFIATAGFPMICSDLGGPSTWGSDTAQQRITDAWNFMKTKYGVATDRFILWGGSMGSLNSMIYALDHPERVKAIGVALPIMDPEQVRTDPSHTYTADIEAVYGTATPVPSAKRPITRAATLSVPARLWKSDDDTVGSPAIADQFAAASGATITSMGAHGHNYNFIDFASAINWLRPHVAATH